MTELILIRYIHFTGIMIVVAMVIAELVLVRSVLQRATIRKIWMLDNIYGLFSLIVVGAGLYLWLGIGKTASFYSTNPVFHTKIGLFIVVGILSIWPTVFYFKQRKGDQCEQVEVPRYMKRIIIAELTILGIIPLLGTLMAQGVGL